MDEMEWEKEAGEDDYNKITFCFFQKVSLIIKREGGDWKRR